MPDADTNWYSDDNATFGDRLATARERAGLSQTDLAHKLGVKESTLIAWEEDRKEPRANRLSTLAGMLGISLSWLLTGEGHGPDSPSDKDSRVAELLGQMRQVHREIGRSQEKLTQLEAQLQTALDDAL